MRDSDAADGGSEPGAGDETEQFDAEDAAFVAATQRGALGVDGADGGDAVDGGDGASEGDGAGAEAPTEAFPALRADADEAGDAALDRGPAIGDDDLVMDPDAACDLLSDHGGEIVIMDDGRIVFMNAAAHLVELAHALEPENEDIRARWERVQSTRAAVEAAGSPREADAGGAEANPAGEPGGSGGGGA